MFHRKSGLRMIPIFSWTLSWFILAGFSFPLAEALETSQQEEVFAKELQYPTSTPRPAPCLVWTDPRVKPRIALLCIHGLGLHKGTFQELGQKLCSAGVATYALDMRGFGEYVEKTKHPRLDFDGCLADIKAAMEQIHRDNPGAPLVILGESMGGAIALRATALYPELVSGLISSVPAGDRFSLGADAATKVGLSAIFGGLNKPVEDVAETVIEHATKKPELRRRWKSDPLARLTFTPIELMQFDSFMDDNFKVAKEIKNTPVLFIQGANDRLVRPAGTWKLFDRLATSNRQLVLSKTSEHLIFEEAQFSPEDLSFVLSWLDRNIAHLNPEVVSTPNKLPAVASMDQPPATTDTVTTAPNTVPPATIIKPSTTIATAPASPIITKHSMELETPTTINYWIELYRDDKLYRCNNKMQFQSGDVIRFHLIPHIDGYAYLVMTAGTTGKTQVLFPNPEGGTDNFLRVGQDYAIPSISWLKFDKTPGTEHLKLLFSKEKINVVPESIEGRYVTCYVSPDASGAKDMVPTRMKLTWNDPKPVLIPDNFAGISQIESSSSSATSSLVRVASGSEGAALCADIALRHE
jgi:alpha-beta hydrolase superfamily lysophospholipase